MRLEDEVQDQIDNDRRSQDLVEGIDQPVLRTVVEDFDGEPSDEAGDPLYKKLDWFDTMRFRFPRAYRVINVIGSTILGGGLGAGLGAAVGATIGTVVFPGLGSLAGAAIGAQVGAVMGATSGLTVVGAVEFAKSQGRSFFAGAALVGGGSLTGVGIGALLGTLVFPGLGTAAGMIVGGSIGFLATMIPSASVLMSKYASGVRTKGDIKTDFVGTGMGVLSGAAAGAILGSFVPGIGNIVGAVGGAIFGLAASLTGVGIARMVSHRGSNGFAGLGVMLTGTTIGGAGVGAVVGAIVGTVLFPGLGTMAGIAVCSAIGGAIGLVVPAIASLIADGIRQSEGYGSAFKPERGAEVELNRREDYDYTAADLDLDDAPAADSMYQNFGKMFTGVREKFGRPTFEVGHDVSQADKNAHVNYLVDRANGRETGVNPAAQRSPML